MSREKLLTDLPKPEGVDQGIYDFAIDIARHIIENPAAAKNGYRIGQDMRPLTRFEHPFQTLANIGHELPRPSQAGSDIALCVSALAARLNEKHRPRS